MILRLFLPATARWLDVAQQPHHVDYVLVLPGVAAVRAYVAAAWVNVGLADNVLVIRNVESPDVLKSLSMTIGEMTRQILLTRGVSDEQIIILDQPSGFTFAANAVSLMPVDQMRRRVDVNAPAGCLKNCPAEGDC